MCGIAGIVEFDRRARVEPGLLEAMADSIAHRGPDAEGYFVDGAVGLAHRRLSIIDLEGGVQPLFNEDRSAVVVFNGEIYNYEALAEKLEARGHRFATRSDTETIVRAWKQTKFEFYHFRDASADDIPHLLKRGEMIYESLRGGIIPVVRDPKTGLTYCKYNPEILQATGGVIEPITVEDFVRRHHDKMSPEEREEPAREDGERRENGDGACRQAHGSSNAPQAGTLRRP